MSISPCLCFLPVILYFVCIFLWIGQTNWLAVTTNRQQSPHHRLVPERGKHCGNIGGWVHPEPALPQRLSSQPAVVMETAISAREPHTPGVWCAVRSGGAREWGLQVRSWHWVWRHRKVTQMQPVTFRKCDYSISNWEEIKMRWRAQYLNKIGI